MDRNELRVLVDREEDIITAHSFSDLTPLVKELARTACTKSGKSKIKIINFKCQMIKKLSLELTHSLLTINVLLRVFFHSSNAYDCYSINSLFPFLLICLFLQ